SLLDPDEPRVARQSAAERIGGRGRVALAEPDQAEQDERPSLPARARRQNRGPGAGLGQAIGPAVQADQLQECLGIAGLDAQGATEAVAPVLDAALGDQAES